MGAFGGTLWGGGNFGVSNPAGVPLQSLIMPAYRIAGLTQRALIIPSDDMFAEAIPELNRMLSSWNCDGHKIFTSSIAVYPLTNGQKTYTIGPGGDFDTARPIFIKGATCLFPTTPVYRQPVHIMDDDEWRHVAIQDIPGAPVYQLYYDGGYDTNGRGTIYVRFQPPSGYSLELYTWQSLQSSFTARTDVAIFPPGYEQALVYSLAKQLAALNPNMANMAPASYAIADKSLATLIGLNSRSPKIDCEPALGGYDGGDGYGWTHGPF